jgi:hypothetical protein
MDIALLTVLTYQIYIILMDLALLTVLTEQSHTISLLSKKVMFHRHQYVVCFVEPLILTRDSSADR